MNYDQWKLMSDRDGDEQELIDKDLSDKERFENYMSEENTELDEIVTDYIEYLESKIIQLNNIIDLENGTKRDKKD